MYWITKALFQKYSTYWFQGEGKKKKASFRPALIFWPTATCHIDVIHPQEREVWTHKHWLALFSASPFETVCSSWNEDLFIQDQREETHCGPVHMQVLLSETHLMIGENLDKSFLSYLKQLCPTLQVNTRLRFYSGSIKTPLSSWYRVE